MPELESGQWVQGLKMLTPDQTLNKKNNNKQKSENKTH